MISLRKWLLAGLLVIVPLAITAWVLLWVVGTLDQTLLILPESWRPQRLIGFYIPGFGVLLTVGIVLLVGAAASNFLGRRLVALGDSVVSRIPVVRSIYSSVKQVSDTLFSESGNAFRTAVLVQWPSPGMWTVGFVTGTPASALVSHLEGEFLSVYIPTTPNPTSGYLMMFRRSECIELKMGVDEALRYVISMGVVVPGASPTNR